MDMETSSRKKKILVLDDEVDITKMIKLFLEYRGYQVTATNSVEEANEEIRKSIRSGKFHLAIIDVKMGSRSGLDFAKRLIDLGMNIGIILMTGHPDHMDNLTYQPDGSIMKPFNMDTLSNSVEHVLEGKSKATISARWESFSDLYGLNAVKFFSHRITETEGDDVEKITGVCVSDGEKIPFVNYRYPEEKDTKKRRHVIAVSSLLGCKGMCSFCINWTKRSLPFIRKLTTEEIICQAYISLCSHRLSDTFFNDFTGNVIINATCEGDGLVYNLDNLCKAFWNLSSIKKPELNFIITSIGNEESLETFIEKYIDLPRIMHYWSVNTLNEQLRAKLMPGTKGQSLERTRDLYQKIAEKTDKEVTASWILIKDMTDRKEDAAALNDFFADRPFQLKVMALNPGSLKGVKDITEKDIETFMNMIKLPKRFRDIYGKYEYSGCGNTLPEGLIVNG